MKKVSSFLFRRKQYRRASEVFKNQIKLTSSNGKAVGFFLAEFIQHPYWLIGSFFVFYLTLYGDSIAFSLNPKYSTSLVYFCVKLVVLLLLMVGSQLIPKYIKKIRQEGLRNNPYIMFFLVYFLINLVILFLTYPGNFTGGDEIYVLLGSRTLDLSYTWHHILTVLFYATSLGTFPSLGTIVGLEVLVFSLVFAYMFKTSVSLFGKKAGYFIVALSLLPSVLLFNISPLRLSFTAIFEMLLFFEIIRKYISKEEVSARWTVLTMVLVGILSSLRTESIVYLVLIPVVLYLLFSRKNNRVRPKTIIISVVVGILVFLPINALQTSNDSERRQYQVTGLFEPLSYIVKNGDYNYSDKAYARDVINKAIDYDGLVAGKDANLLYWSRPDRSISKSDLDKFKKLTVQLAIQNFPRYLKGITKDFLKSNNAWGELVKGGVHPEMDLRFTSDLLVSQPMSHPVRNVTIDILRGTSFDYARSTEFVRIIYSAIPSFILVGVLTVICIKKKVLLGVILAPLIAKNLIIILFAPMPSFYYYYPMQLCGLIVFFMFMMGKVFRREGNRECV